jgi:hypothetical protein
MYILITALRVAADDFGMVWLSVLNGRIIRLLWIEIYNRCDISEYE